MSHDDAGVHAKQVTTITTAGTIAADRHEATRTATIAATTTDALHEYAGREVTPGNDVTRIECRDQAARARCRAITADRHETTRVTTVAATAADALREDAVRQESERVECAAIVDHDIAAGATAGAFTANRTDAAGVAACTAAATNALREDRFRIALIGRDITIVTDRDPATVTRDRTVTTNRTDTSAVATVTTAAANALGEDATCVEAEGVDRAEVFHMYYATVTACACATADTCNTAAATACATTTAYALTEDAVRIVVIGDD